MSIVRTQLGGLLGGALDANRTGRLSHFITDESSAPIALFDPTHVAQNHEGDWYGEHAGKWLYAAAKAAARADSALAANVRRVADHLASLQQPDGYLGNYAPERRFTRKQAPPTRSWDGAPAQRTWDVWVHAYLVLGFLEVHRHFPEARYLDAARRIGDLCWRTLTDRGIDVTHLGNHHGLSATVFLDAAMELHLATGEPRYLDLARLILQQAENRAELRLHSAVLAGVDAAEIATGKAYQVCWMLVGLAKLGRATNDERLLGGVRAVAESIRRHHLTLGGGPWGGVALRSREVFNAAGVFSPYGYVETCATFAWIQLNRELLAITGDAQHAEDIERAAYNDLLGAQAPNGEDWCYYSFPNGRRVHTTYWRCCKSSGAMALEELPELAFTQPAEDVIAVNLYGPARATLPLASAGTVTIEQVTRYPFDGTVRIHIDPERAARFAVRVRIPSWAWHATLAINGRNSGQASTPGTFATVDRNWQRGDEILLQLPMQPVLHRQSNRNVQESRAPDGSAVRQEVLRFDYVALTRGPLVYSTGLIDGYKIEETMRLAEGRELSQVAQVDAPAGYAGPALRLSTQDRPPVILTPYYEAGGRADGAWRLTWLQLSPVK